jgi:small subunit ribosomal protein S15
MISKSYKKDRKAQIVGEHARTQSDTGSPEVQVALITDRINDLNRHFQTHRNDKVSMKGLMLLVGQRRRLLNYLRTKSEERYTKVLKALDLRK